MKKHMIGPYTVEDDMLCRDSQRIMTPAMAVMYDGLNCFAHKIGGRNGVLNWHKTFSKLHPESAHELYIVVLEREKISADDACTMFKRSDEHGCCGCPESDDGRKREINTKIY